MNVMCRSDPVNARCVSPALRTMIAGLDSFGFIFEYCPTKTPIINT